MITEKKVSQMIIDIAGDLLTTPESQEEMQAHLNVVRTAWNIAIKPELARKKELKSFIKKQAKYAPSTEALEGLELEMKRMIQQKNTLYPSINGKVVSAEVIKKGQDDYVIRAYFSGNRET
ncbi:MAG: hypothetical protein COA42_15185 [Alteromonadaceae bacterium]|nr:MAG: hypothetical protein COA42_15185 [Alteromonadaceae bacterium]